MESLVKKGGMAPALEALRCARLASAAVRTGSRESREAFYAALSHYLTEVTRTFNMISSALAEDNDAEKAWKDALLKVRNNDELLRGGFHNSLASAATTRNMHPAWSSERMM